MYQYNARVTRIIDGDTIALDVDLGFHTWLTGQHFRLADISARELKEPGGQEARDHLAGLLPPGTPVEVRSIRDDKYGGRYAAEIVIMAGPNAGELLGPLLVRERWAAPWIRGRGTRPTPPWPRTE